MVQLGVTGGTDPALPGPAASPLHDALNAVAAAAHAAIGGHGFGLADLWPLLGRFGLARHLAESWLRKSVGGAGPELPHADPAVPGGGGGGQLACWCLPGGAGGTWGL